MSKFRSRLFFSLSTLIVIVFLSLGFLLGQLFQFFYFFAYENQFKKESQLVKIVVKNEGIESPEIAELLGTISETLDSRIILFDEGGNVLFEKGPAFQQNSKELAKKMLAQHRYEEKGFRIDLNQAHLYFYGMPLFDNGGKKGFVVLGKSLNAVPMTKEIWFFISGSMMVAFIVLMMFGMRIMKQYTRPIESAANVAMELAKGNYKARTYEENNDEIGMLSRSINILARNLQDMTSAQELQQERLQTLIENMGSGLIFIDERGYIHLVNKAFKELFQIDQDDYLYKPYNEAFAYKEIIQMVDEIFLTESRKRKHLMLPVKIERKHFEVYGAPILGKREEWKGIVLVFYDITELKKLEQMRKDFVANVSHELKTPITSIKGFSETLLDGAMKDEQTLKSFLSIILKESERMQTLIQDLLDLSKIEQQGFKLDFQTCHINEILKEIYTLLSRKAIDKNIGLSLKVPNEDIMIHGDPYRLKQIFINLVNNGIMYTPSGGEVNILVKADQDIVEVSVQDTGIGIKEDKIPRIFERFYRIDKARSRNSGGTGLGLAIVKHLVEAHRAKIDVKSKVGEGTIFTVTFQRLNPS